MNELESVRTLTSLDSFAAKSWRKSNQEQKLIEEFQEPPTICCRFVQAERFYRYMSIV